MQPLKLCTFASLGARQAGGALRGLGRGGAQIWHAGPFGEFVQVSQRQREQPAPFFDSAGANGQQTDVHGFCEQADGTPACTGEPCCCWSSFGEASHPAYPNDEEAENARRCMNPPVGFIYVTQPGATHDDGQMDFLRSGNSPLYAGRDLCCLMLEGDPLAQSMIDPNNGATSFRDAMPTTAPTIPPVPTPEVPAALPAPILPVIAAPAPAPMAAQELIDQDYETMQMESAARSHAEAAESLGAASADLGASVQALGDVQHVLASSPVVARKRAHVAHMRAAIANFNSDRASQGDYANMLNVTAPR